MKKLTIALLQLLPEGADLQANLLKGAAACRTAAAMDADVALFPEMWSIGYRFFDPTLPGDRERWEGLAVSRDSPFVHHYQSLAAELDISIGLTYLEQDPGGPLNSLSLIDRSGRIALHYSKVHTCDFSEEAALQRGSGFPVCDLDTRAGLVRMGAMICYDREFPESARLLMLQGAEIVLTPNACEMEKMRTLQFQTRAMENMMGVALTNYPAPQENGHSVAYDGITFDEHGSRDMLLVQAGPAEGIYLAHFDLDALRAYRNAEAWGNAYRRPNLYQALSDEAVHPPFHRPDARR